MEFVLPYKLNKTILIFQVLHDTIVLIYQKDFLLKKGNFQKKIVIFEDSITMVSNNCQFVLVLNNVVPKRKKKKCK